MSKAKIGSKHATDANLNGQLAPLPVAVLKELHLIELDTHAHANEDTHTRENERERRVVVRTRMKNDGHDDDEKGRGMRTANNRTKRVDRFSMQTSKEIKRLKQKIRAEKEREGERDGGV